MTLIIKRMNFTNLLNAQVTAACRHAEHAPSPAMANYLYEIAEDLNRIAANIQKRNLAAILDGPLPTGRPVAQDDADGPEPDIAPDAQIPAAPANSDTPTQQPVRPDRPDRSGRPGRPGRPPLRNAAPVQKAETSPKPLTQRQRIQNYIAQHPGSTAVDVASGLDIKYTSVASECKQLKDIGRLRSEGKSPIRYFPIHPTPPTAQAADTTRAPAIPT